MNISAKAASKTVAGGLIVAIVGGSLTAHHMEDPLRWLAFLPIKCPLSLLGFSCPTCGLGRSVIAALSGNLVESLRFHPLGMVLIAMVTSSALLMIVAPDYLKTIGRHLSGRISAIKLWVLAFAYIVWGLLR